MQHTFTQKKFGSKFLVLILALLFSVAGTQVTAQNYLNRTPAAKSQAELLKDKLAYEAKMNSISKTASNDAGLPSAPRSVNRGSNPTSEAVCQTFTGSLAAGDLTMSPRFFRGGAPANGDCTTPYPFPGTSGTGPYYYDVHTYTNNTGLTQCGTFSLSTTDIVNANIQFAIYNNTFVPANLATNYLADPDASTGTPAAALSCQLTVNAGQTIQIIVFSANVNSTAAGTASDYSLTIDFPLCSSTPCAGTPTPGNTIASVASTCAGLPVNLSLQNNTAGAGVTYQWQSSPTGAAGTFTNIVGATSATYTANPTATGFYQAIVTCGANSGTSTPVQVAVVSCYCTAGATSTAFEKIGRVQFGSINNASTSTAGYEDFTTITGNAYIGSTMPITVTLTGGFAADQVFVWIDFNKDYDFDDAGELVYTSTLGVGPHTGNITIPATVANGNTRMRVRMHDSSLGPNATPCGTSSYGQVEDYTVNLVPCVPASVSTQPANKSVACGGNTTFTVALAGSDAAVVNWQYKTSAASTNWLDLSNTAPYSGVTTNTLTITAATAAMNGYQYRVVYKGACTGTSFTNAATLTVTPLVAAITNSLPINKCVSDAPVRIAITNLSGGTATASTASGTLHTNIPDNNDETIGENTNAINHSINVTNVPAGVTINGFRVRLNLTHAWVGDMVIVLRAPNGKIISLDYALTSTGGAGPTSGFTNTVISSTATAALSSGANPYTGNFRLDNVGPTQPGFTPSGPAGFDPNTTNISDMFQGNGAWTLAMYDYYGDFTTANFLENWEISIDYGAAATGVFTPSTGLFTDPAGTVAYTGTAVNEVYANPAASTNYSLVVTTPTCTSDPLTIPVNIRQLPTAINAVPNAAVCQDGDASFTTAAANGAPGAYQWQVSADNGATYTNVANGGVYSNATTTTLNITGATASMNGYRYRLVASAAPCAGTVTSAAGTLTVNPLPVLNLTANPYTAIYPGQTTTLTVASSTTVPANGYTWYRNGVVVPGATGNTLVVDVDGLGEYTVTAADANSCGNANAVSVTITSAPNDIMFIYPSPNTGQFQIRYYSAAGNNPLPRMVNIYDSKGARVYSRTYTVAAPYTRLNVDMTSGFQKGIYQVELADRNGIRIKTGRVVIL